MTIFSIPLQQIASQSVAVTLNNQNCIVSLRELNGRQYFSLSISGKTICQNILIQDRTKIVRAAYLGLVGDFVSYDTQGNEPPLYTGWGDRWVLTYDNSL
jgi:hypothetical protein